MRSVEVGSLFVNGERKATFLAKDTVARTGGVHHQTAFDELSIFIGLRTGQDQNVFETSMFVNGNASSWFEPDQSGRGPVIPVTVQPMKVHSGMKRLPSQRAQGLQDIAQVGNN
jgi:hypothetical protein